MPALRSGPARARGRCYTRNGRETEAYMRLTTMILALLALLALAANSATAKDCGGPLSLKCATDEWCSYAQSNLCGAEGQTGTCEKRPSVCTMDFIPVCGCDGRTYPNRCGAHSAGMSIAFAGRCKESK